MKCRTAASFVVFLFVASSVFAQGSAPQNGYFLSGGVKLHYMAAGEGEPVVLLHGFSASAYINWMLPGVFQALSKHYRVIALDARGHGGSGKPHEVDKYGTEMVDDVVRLLDYLNIKQAHVVGYSMGAFITTKLLATHPDRLLSATLGGAGWSREEDDHSIIESVARSLDAGKGITPLIQALTPSGQEPPTDDQLQTRNQIIMMTNDSRALAACIRGMARLTVPREQLVKNKIPVLAIIGEKDPLKRTVDPMVGVMANLTVVVVPNGDHISTFRSAQFRDALRDFLAAHSHLPSHNAAAVGK